MPSYNYGPAEFITAQLCGDFPDAEVVASMKRLLDAQAVRLLDLVIIKRDADGIISFIERNDIENDSLRELVPEISGLTAEDDINDVAKLIEPGRSGIVMLLEHTWAAGLAAAFHKSQGKVVYSERIPANIINAIANDEEIA